MLYYLFSNFRLPVLDNIYSGLPNKSSNWMVSFRKPTTFYLNPTPTGQYSIVGDEGMMPTSHEVLMQLGHVV